MIYDFHHHTSAVQSISFHPILNMMVRIHFQLFLSVIIRKKKEKKFCFYVYEDLLNLSCMICMDSKGL